MYPIKIDIVELTVLPKFGLTEDTLQCEAPFP